MKKFGMLFLTSTLALNLWAKDKEPVEMRTGQQSILLSEEFNKPKKFANYTVIGCSVHQNTTNGVIIHDVLSTIKVEFEQQKIKGKMQNYMVDGFKDYPDLDRLIKVIERRKLVCHPSFANQIIKWPIDY